MNKHPTFFITNFPIMKYFLLAICSFGASFSLLAQDLLQTIPNAHSDKINALAISENGQTVFSAGNDETINIWSAKTGQNLGKLGQQNDQILDLEISGNELISAGRERDIFVWDIDKKKQKSKLQGHDYHVEDLDVSSNKNWLASASRDNSVKVWNLNTNENSHSIKGHGADVKAIAISVDGKFIASVDKDKTLRIWKIEGKELIKKMNGRSLINHIAFSNDGQYLVAATDKVVTIWETKSWTIHQRLRAHSSKITHLKFHPDGQHFATCSNDQKVIFWNIETGKVQFSFIPHSGVSPTAIAISKDGKTFATASSNREVKIWELQLLKKNTMDKFNDN